MPNKRERFLARLEEARSFELEALLLEYSGLPGRRPNVDLAAALADHLTATVPSTTVWGLLDRWAALGVDRAPTNTAMEFLPFCAFQTLGACYIRCEPPRQEWIVGKLRQAARDSRPRVREASSLGLRRLGEPQPVALADVLCGWLPDASLLDRCAMLTCLAHPPLLEHSELLEFALDLADSGIALLEQVAIADADLEIERGSLSGCDFDLQAFGGRRALGSARVDSSVQQRGVDRVAAAAPMGGDRPADQRRALRKSLEFAPSVYAAAAPGPGFALLRRWAARESQATRKIVVANLRKARLARYYPDEVEAVAAELSWADG